MNRRERAVLLFLAATFIVGAGITVLRRQRLARLAAGSPIRVENAVDTTHQSGGLLDLNRAQAYELEALPGIGPKLAQRIISYREQHGGFKQLEELRKVSGIGPKRFATLKELVVVKPHDPPAAVIRAAQPADTGPRSSR